MLFTKWQQSVLASQRCRGRLSVVASMGVNNDDEPDSGPDDDASGALVVKPGKQNGECGNHQRSQRNQTNLQHWAYELQCMG